jgi:predicted ATPase/DNA-binding SARP family transcriptional activator
MNGWPAHMLHIRFLGQVVAFHHNHDHNLALRLSRKTRALLAYLAATDQAHDRRSLQAMFCQNAGDPASVLRWHLSRIRRLLGVETLQETAVGLTIAPHVVWVDSRAFAQLLATPPAQLDLETLQQAVALYRGDFLAGLALPDSPEFELWLLGERAYYRNLAVRSWQELAKRAVAGRRYDEAIGWLQQILQHDPLLEEAHAHLIWLYARTGQRQAAIHQYKICGNLLRQELAVEPSAGLQALYQEVLSGQIRPLPLKETTATVERAERPGVFVGRQAELSRLDQLWDKPGQSVVLLEAVAGGGKTRLVHEFAARSPAALFLMGHCYESTRSSPYHPWLEIVEERLSSLDDAVLERFPRFWLERLAWLFPPLAARLSLGAPGPREMSGEGEQLLLAIAHLLFEGGSENHTPLLIFVDDLQWADEASLQLFHFLALRVAERPVLLIGAFRSEEVEDSPALRTLLHDLARIVTPPLRWRLPPLPPEAIMEVTARLWPQLAEGFRPHVSSLLAQATGGNPFFLTELLRELAHSAEPPAAMPIPATVQELVERRLQHFSESGRQVIEALAILDAPARPDQARQISGRSEEETITAVDLGLRRGLLQTVGVGRPTRYTFAHDLVCQAVTAQLSGARRQLLHRRCAAMLVQESGRQPAPERAALSGRIAGHAWQGEAFDLVWQWAPLAAAHARRLYAYSDALSFYEMASAAYELLPAEATLDGGPAKLIDCYLYRILLGAAAGRPLEEQQALRQKVQALLEEQPDKQQQALFYLCQAAYYVGLAEYEQATAAARQGHELYLQLGDWRQAARCLAQAGEARTRLSQNQAARRYLEQALALYETAGDVEGVSHCLSGLAWAALNLGQVEAALAYLQRALALNQQQHDLLGQAHVTYTLAAAWLYYYQAEQVRGYARQARELFQQMGYQVMVARTVIYEGLAYRLEGNWAEAEKIYRQVLTDAPLYADAWLEGWTAQALGRAVLWRGDLAEAERLFQQAYQRRRQSGEAQNVVSDLAWLGRLRLAQGRAPEALQHTTAAVRQMEEAQGEYYVWETPDVYLCHAEALLAVGRNAEAGAYIERAYQALQEFAAQIKDSALKESFLLHWSSARIREARETGQIPPFVKIR